MQFCINERTPSAWCDRLGTPVPSALEALERQVWRRHAFSCCRAQGSLVPRLWWLCCLVHACLQEAMSKWQEEEVFTGWTTDSWLCGTGQTSYIVRTRWVLCYLLYVLLVCMNLILAVWGGLDYPCHAHCCYLCAYLPPCCTMLVCYCLCMCLLLLYIHSAIYLLT
jgi:hypothetical protein